MEANWSDPEYVRGRARRKTIWIVGFVLHLVLFGGLVGWPYVRGEMRGRDSRRAFGAFAACFYGGEVTGEAGLSLPAGDRLAYASLYLSGDPDWPGRCRPLLSKLIDGEPFLLYPGVKGAEERVRQTAALADQELASLAGARADPRGRIPTEPLAAVSRVAGSLAELAREIDPLTPIEDEVIRFEDVSLPDPARVPLTTASDAVVDVAVYADGIRVRAVDARGLSRTRSVGGRSRAGRIRRPGTVRAMIDGPGEDPILVYATSESRCREDAYGCSRRSTGIAEWVFGEGPVEPLWLSGHPRGRIDRVLALANRSLTMVAVAADGVGAELRHYALPEAGEATPADHGADADPSGEAENGDATPAMLAPELRVPLGISGVDDAMVARGLVAYSVADEESGEVRFFARVGAAPPRLLAELAGAEPFILACDAHPFFAFGTAESVVVVEAGESGPVEGHRQAVQLGAAPFDPRRPSRDRARLSCDATGASLTLHRGDGRLELVSCPRGAPCAAPQAVAEDAGGYDAVRAEGATVVAWSRADGEGGVYVASFGEDSVPARIVAACFADDEGFCGIPRVAERNGRILVATQEGADLRVLETTDGGRTFSRMTGVR